MTRADRHGFEVRLQGVLGPAARSAFADLDVEIQPACTVICGVLTQRQLHSLLDRAHELTLELVDVRQIADDATEL